LQKLKEKVKKFFQKETKDRVLLKYQPVNDYNSEKLLYSANELAFWSKVGNICWYFFEVEIKNYSWQDELLSKNDPNWQIHLVVETVNKVEILYGTFSSEEFLKKTSPNVGVIFKQKTNLESLVDYLVKEHTNCYKTQNWEKSTWKFNRSSRQIIGDYLDLLCGGWGPLAPQNTNLWKNTLFLEEKINLKNININAERANILSAMIKQKNINYGLDAYKRNLGKELDNLIF